MIDEHGPALVRDFLLFYRLDIRKIVHALTQEKVLDGWTPGLVLQMAHRLPEGSEFMAELQGSRDYRDWGTLQWLIVNLINQVIINTTSTIAAAGGKPGKPQLFEGMTDKIARPLDGSPVKKKQASLEDVEKNFLAFMTAGEARTTRN